MDLELGSQNNGREVTQICKIRCESQVSGEIHTGFSKGFIYSWSSYIKLMQILVSFEKHVQMLSGPTDPSRLSPGKVCKTLVLIQSAKNRPMTS